MKTLRHLVLVLCLAFTSLVSASPININTADAEALASLNGIGPAKAQAIIDYRTENGNFTDITQLVEVDGIGEKTLEKLKADITIQ